MATRALDGRPTHAPHTRVHAWVASPSRQHSHERVSSFTTGPPTGTALTSPGLVQALSLRPLRRNSLDGCKVGGGD